MRHPTLLTLLSLFTAALLVRGGLADSCGVTSGDDLKIPGTCTSAKFALFSATKVLTLKLEGTGSGKVKTSRVGLKIGECDIGGTLTIGSGEGSLQIDKGGALVLPITVTITKDKAHFNGTATSPSFPSSFSKECSPAFKAIDGGITANFEYSLSKAASGLKVVLIKVRDYSKVAKEASGLPAWALSLIIFGVFLIGGVLLGVILYWCWWKKREANRVRQDEADLKKPVKKKPVKKKPDQPKPDLEKPKTVVEQVNEVKPKKPKKASESSKGSKARSNFSADKNLRTAKGDSFNKHPVELDLPVKTGEHAVISIASDLLTPDFPVRRTDRLDILEKTARDSSTSASHEQPTGTTAECTIEATTEIPLDLVPYKVPKALDDFLYPKKHMKELLEMIGPHQRHEIYFKELCVDVFDISFEILKDIEENVRKGTFSESQIAEFRQEVSKVKELAKEVHASILSDPKKAHWPWTCKFIWELGYLTKEQIKQGFNSDPATEEQTKHISVGLKALREKRRNEIARNEPDDSKMGALIRQLEYLEKIHRNYYRKIEEAQAEKVFDMIDRGELQLYK